MSSSIPVSNPTVVPQQTVPAVTYDTWWIKRLMINGDNPSGKVVIRAVLHKAAMNQDGTPNFSPTDPDLVIVVPDVYAAIAQVPALGTAEGAILAAIVAYAQATNVQL